MGVDGASPVHSLATQTFEEVGSRGWQKGHHPLLSLHWYHYRNFKQYWEKRAGCYKPTLAALPSGLLLSLRGRNSLEHRIFALSDSKALGWRSKATFGV